MTSTIQNLLAKALDAGVTGHEESSLIAGVKRLLAKEGLKFQDLIAPPPSAPPPKSPLSLADLMEARKERDQNFRLYLRTKRELEETKAKLAQTRFTHAGSVWMYSSSGESKRVLPTDVKQYKKLGWVEGRGRLNWNRDKGDATTAP